MRLSKFLFSNIVLYNCMYMHSSHELIAITHTFIDIFKIFQECTEYRPRDNQGKRVNPPYRSST